MSSQCLAKCLLSQRSVRLVSYQLVASSEEQTNEENTAYPSVRRHVWLAVKHIRNFGDAQSSLLLV